MNPINAKDFGAVGDGVTDDSAAIQAAVDYANKDIEDCRVCGINRSICMETECGAIMDNWINDIDEEEIARLIDEGFRAEIRRIWTEVMDRSNHSLDCNPDECGHSGVCEAKRR